MDASKQFWYKTSGGIRITKSGFLEFLASNGFAKQYFSGGYRFVKSEGRIIKELTAVNIKDFVIDFINTCNEQSKNELKSLLLRNSYDIFSRAFLEFLPALGSETLKDSKDNSYFYFKNCIVEVTKNNIRKTEYSKINKMINEGNIINRDFEISGDYSCFNDFLLNVTGKNHNRYEALLTALGYLLHKYKDPSNARAVIFMDEKISLDASGRSGKSLLGKALSLMRRSVRIDGRNFKFDKNFAFQSINTETDIIEFNDASKNFNFEKLFSIITDNITIEKKNHDEFFIPFEQSPKILISTNYSVNGFSDSSTDRQFVIEFTDHYNKNHTPVKDFGKRFFEDWNEKEWNSFYNLMMLCVSLYLEKGFAFYSHTGSRIKKLNDFTSPEFCEFTEEISTKVEYNKKVLLEKFKTDFPDYSNLKQNTFTKWLNIYASLYDLRLVERKSNGKRFIRLV